MPLEELKMKIKRNTILIIITLCLMFLLVACGPAATPTAEPTPPPEPITDDEPDVEVGIQPASEIVIYHWSEYIDPDVYSLFQQEYDIRVIEDNFSSNEEMLAKLQGGGTGYALIVPSDYTVEIMINEGLLSRLDHANLTNLDNLSAQFRQVPYDPGNQYCVPYQWGTTGIGYLASEVEEPTSWAAFFEPDMEAAYYGRMSMLDDARESFAAALIYLGYDINTTNETQLHEARDLLISMKGALSGYNSDMFGDLVASGENLMAHGWNGDFLVAQEDNEDLEYTIPEEGGVIWVDNLCIPSTVTPEQKLAAEMFMDFVLRADIAAMISEYTYYASPNEAAKEYFDEDFLEDPAVYPPDELLAKLFYIEPVGEFESVFQRLWDEVKTAPIP
jgi:spermidine/putrescine transport system substrate-binding protein